MEIRMWYYLLTYLRTDGRTDLFAHLKIFVSDAGPMKNMEHLFHVLVKMSVYKDPNFYCLLFVNLENKYY